MAGCVKFSVLDLKLGFFHIKLHESARPYTAFMTKKGLMQMTRLVNGATCAPEIFQRTMEERLAGIEGLAIFVDDMVIGGRTEAEHDERLLNSVHLLTRLMD